jgi:hypothetical protein
MRHSDQQTFGNAEWSAAVHAHLDCVVDEAYDARHHQRHALARVLVRELWVALEHPQEEGGYRRACHGQLQQ